MDPKTIQVLASVKEFAKNELAPKKILTSRDAMAEIQRLEALLGCQPSMPVWNVMKANQKIEKLRAELAAKSPPKAVAETAAIVAPPAAKELHGRALFAASTKIEGGSERDVPEGVTGRDRMKAAMKIDGEKH